MYCPRCYKEVNVRENKAFIGIAWIINWYCEECNVFIGSKIETEGEED